MEWEGITDCRVSGKQLECVEDEWRKGDYIVDFVMLIWVRLLQCMM